MEPELWRLVFGLLGGMDVVSDDASWHARTEPDPEEAVYRIDDEDAEQGRQPRTCRVLSRISSKDGTFSCLCDGAAVGAMQVRQERAGISQKCIAEPDSCRPNRVDFWRLFTELRVFTNVWCQPPSEVEGQLHRIT